MLGGIIMNVIVAIVVYAMVLFIWGDKKIPGSSLKYGISVTDSTLYKIGLRSGDKIISIDGKKVTDFEHLLKSILLSDDKITIERDQQNIDLKVPVDLLGQLIESKKQGKISLIEPRKPSIVFYVPDTSAAYKAGLRDNDKIVQIDSVPIVYHDDIVNTLKGKAGQQVNLTINRHDSLISLRAPVNSDAKLGFVPYGYDYFQMDSLGWLKMEITKYSVFSAFPAAVAKAGGDLSFYVAQFKKMGNYKTGAYKGMGGFKGIANAFPGVWNWESFWSMTAFLSIVLAFMNLLPIPALDGGHVMFTLYEMITRRKPNEKFLEYAQMAGMIFLLLLMLYANGNDWFGWGK
jgi:regulator of sigma E protease